MQRFVGRCGGILVSGYTGLFGIIVGDVTVRVDVCRITKGAHIERL